MENAGHDMLSQWARQHTKLPENIKVILIDEASLQYMENSSGRWPWPRAVYKDIIEFINLGQPRAIHFDILFSERETVNPEQTNDAILVQSTREANNVIHAIQLLSDDNIPAQALPADIIHHSGTPVGSALPDSIYRDYLAPFPALQQASYGVGVVNAKVDADGIYRSTRPYYRYADTLLPALSIAAARKLDSQRINRQFTPEQASSPQLVNFYAEVPAYSMSGIIESAKQLQQGSFEHMLIDPQVFADSYVFIGASAIGLHDLKQTPLSALAPGVFIHAAFLGNLLSGDRLYPVDWRILFLLLPLLSLCVSGLVLFSRSMSLQLLVPLLMSGAYLLLATVLRYNNLQIALTTPLLSIGISWLAAYAYLFSAEERERKQIRQLFSRYVSPAALSVVLKQLDDVKSAASGSRETISVLFADMRGFTSLSESLPAEDIVRILNHYFSMMTDIIFRHGGTVDKFIGDAIMATWGAPLPSDTHALDAVLCAISMQQALPNINQWLTQQDLPEISIGIGIHTGEAIMGSLGSQQKADFTVIGDTVNIASRLEGVCKLYHRTIVISDDSWQAVSGQIDCQLLDCIKVKGKDQALRIYAPLAKRQADHEDNLNRHIDNMSQQAFDFYAEKQWQACLDVLEQFPAPYRLPHLEQHCRQYLDTPPNNDWQPVQVLQSK